MSISALDIVIATCDRPILLHACIESILSAASAYEGSVRVIVVDNGKNETAIDVTSRFADAALNILVLREPVSGKSRALNLALAHVRAPLIAFLDDDERITASWFTALQREFGNQDTDFIGGPYELDLVGPLPNWVPGEYSAVLGSTAHIATRMRYEAESGPVLMGGNAVVRHTLLERVGTFDVNLGPSASDRQRTGEDHDMFLRYLAAGATGWFVPDLRILHHVPPTRLQKSYFRGFVKSHARAQAQLDLQRPQAVSRVFGLPRYRVGTGIRAIGQFLTPHPARRFLAELRVRELLYFVKEHFAQRSVLSQPRP